MGARTELKREGLKEWGKLKGADLGRSCPEFLEASPTLVQALGKRANIIIN